MASAAPQQRQDKEKRLRSIITFADEIQTKLSSPLTTSSDLTSLINRLDSVISTFPQNSFSVAAPHYSSLDKAGTSLWNLCTRLRRTSDWVSETNGTNDIDYKSRKLLSVMVKMYAFLILDCAQWSGQGTGDNKVRVMKVALKVARECLESEQYDCTLKVLEKAASYEASFGKDIAATDPGEDEVKSGLSAEYFVLRTALAWRQGQLPLAEYMFVQSRSNKRPLDPASSEKMADILYEMGKEQLGTGQYELATKWLDRAYSMLMAHQPEKLSADAVELRTSIIQSSVTALLGTRDEAAAEQAEKLVLMLEGELGDKLVVLLLRLELLEGPTNKSFDAESYAMVLRRMVRTAVLNDRTFKMIMHHVRHLNDKSPILAYKVLDELFRGRLIEQQNDQWLEAVLVNRLWMASQNDGLDVITSVQEMLDLLSTNSRRLIGVSAAHAAQTLIWKHVESNYSMGDYETADLWCRLAMHRVFDSAGELNKAKIARKLLLCALARLDPTSATEVFNTMSEKAKSEPLTQCLMFKIAIRNDELEHAKECLEHVSRCADQDPSFLYACILDSQKAGQKKLAIIALQLVLQKYEDIAPPNVHLPALLRCTIKMLIQVLGSKDIRERPEELETIDRICKLFEASVKQAQKPPSIKESVNSMRSVQELDWFSKNSYNLALNYSTDWHPRQLYRLLQSCTKTIDLYPTDIDQHASEDLKLRRIFCDYLSSILLVTLARSEDNIEIQLQNYLSVRKHSASYYDRLQRILKLINEKPAEDLKRKLSCLLAFDFEAAVMLKAWNDLGNVILKAEDCRNMRLYELFADCLLSGDVPHDVLVPRLKSIVNSAWTLADFNTATLSRYMRVLFQSSLSKDISSSHDESSSALALLDSIASHASDALESEVPYPKEELEWIATTAFNRAVDYYCASDDRACREWAEKAISISNFVADGGDLQRVLQAKYLGLNWEADA